MLSKNQTDKMGGPSEKYKNPWLVNLCVCVILLPFGMNSSFSLPMQMGIPKASLQEDSVVFVSAHVN